MRHSRAHRIAQVFRLWAARPVIEWFGNLTVRSIVVQTACVLICASNLVAATHYVTVAGLGGEPEYEQRFSGWAKELDAIWKATGGADNVRTLIGPEATREELRAQLDAISKRTTPDDALVVCLIGHGSFDGADFKFNLPGRDVSAAELTRLLDAIPAKRQLTLVLTSSSGAVMGALRKPNRVVITATKSGTEKNATVFARYWVAALRDQGADIDKNGTISALEAFRYADEKTAKFYESEKRLVTEHALLEDTGKGTGVRTPSADNGQGLLASSFAVARFGSQTEQALQPGKQSLLTRKQQLEERIDRLKYQKAAMPEADYRKQLSVLLLDLARTQAELDK